MKYMGVFIKVFIGILLIFAIISAFKKTKKVQKEYTINLALFSKGWLFFAAILIIWYMFSGFLTADSIKNNVIVDMILLALIIFLCILSVLFCRWHIDINNERIEYCSLSGKNSCRYFNRIIKAEIDEKDNMLIYAENENVLKIPTEIGHTYIITALRYQGICVKYKYSIDDFVMKLPLFYPVMYICFSIIAGLFAVFSMKYYISAGLIWLVLAMASVYQSVSGFKDKVIVKGNVIVQIRLLRKMKKIGYEQIVKVIRREKSNAPHLYIYSKKGLEMKINMLCKNRRLLEELVERHHWMNS